MNASTLSPVKEARRTKILDAAEELFLTQGLRATTMEGVAAAVGMSKVTVYSYFQDKDALFAAVAHRFADRMEALVKDALTRHTRLRDKIEAALIGKHALVNAHIRGTPFAQDIFSAKNRTSGDRYWKLDAWIEAELAQVLDDRASARLLLNASQGIANATEPWDLAEADMKRLIALVLSNRDQDPT